MAHDLGKSPVGDFHIAENDNLVELIGEEGVVDCITLFHQEMPSFLDDARPLRSDVDDHVYLPFLYHDAYFSGGKRLMSSPAGEEREKSFQEVF